jgi:hypothetical protein
LESSGVRVAHFVVDAFAAVTAVGGGTALATGLESDRFPAEMLRGTQFGSYVIPGLILAGVVGGSVAVAAAATLLSPGAGTLSPVGRRNTRNFRERFLRPVP